jgi:hypothetical protein
MAAHIFGDGGSKKTYSALAPSRANGLLKAGRQKRPPKKEKPRRGKGFIDICQCHGKKSQRGKN